MRLIDADAALEIFQGLTELAVGEGAALVKALIFAGLKSRSVTPTVGGWISVEDELPKNQERVVARLSDTENIVCCFYSPDEWWDIEGMWRLKRPTHWMPVIVDEPPEEVKYTWPD